MFRSEQLSSVFTVPDMSVLCDGLRRRTRVRVCVRHRWSETLGNPWTCMHEYRNMSLTFSHTHTLKATLPPQCNSHSLVTLSHPSFSLPLFPLVPHQTHTHLHFQAHPPLPPPPPLSPSAVRSSMSWQKCIHAARLRVPNNSLILLFLGEAKAKKTRLKTHVSEGLWSLMQGRLQKGFKKASGVPVVTVSESRTRHLRAKSFIVERLGVEGGGGRFIY